MLLFWGMCCSILFVFQTPSSSHKQRKHTKAGVVAVGDGWLVGLFFLFSLVVVVVMVVVMVAGVCCFLFQGVVIIC